MKIANTVRAKPVAKLSMEIAREIRRLRVEKKLTHDEIAMAYKIDRSLSSAICRNKAWVEYHKITTIPRRPGKYEVSVTSGVITGDWLNRVNPPRGGV